MFAGLRRAACAKRKGEYEANVASTITHLKDEKDAFSRIN
jgi:hypothetical protein